MNLKKMPTEWIKIGELKNISFINKDVICFGIGCNIKFININTGEEHFYSANTHSLNGEGIKCLNGHRSSNFFCFSECCSHPDIYVIHYPSFEKVSTLEGAPYEGYRCLEFSEVSMIVTLTEVPFNVITVWNWRKGGKIAQKISTINNPNQVLRCSLGKPLYCAQLAVGANFLNIWDIFMCCKKCIITQNTIKIPKLKPATLVDALWTNETSLYVLDSLARVYIMNNEHQLEKIVDFTTPGNLPTSITWYKLGFLIAGPNNEVRHYKKTGVWSCDWSFEPENYIQALKIHKNENLTALLENQDLVVFDKSNGKVTKNLSPNTGLIKMFCLIYPLGEILAILRNDNRLTVCHVKTGKIISELTLHHNAVTITGNPELPYLAIGYNHGLLEFISLHNPENPKMIASVFLTKFAINKIIFSDGGKVVVAANMNNGEFFFLQVYYIKSLLTGFIVLSLETVWILRKTYLQCSCFPPSKLNVIAAVNANVQIVDYIVIVSKDCYRLFVIPRTSPINLEGNKIIRYCVVDKNIINEKEYKFKDSNMSIYQISATSGKDKHRIFYVLSSSSKYILEMTTKRGNSFAKLERKFSSGHLLQKFSLIVTKYHCITFGHDGFVIIRDKRFQKLISKAITHHRAYFGVKQACIDPMEKYIISLGNDNVLSCTNLISTTENLERFNAIRAIMDSSALELLFQVNAAECDMEGKNWLELQESLLLKNEEELCKAKCIEIHKELSTIKKNLQDLVTENIHCDEIEKLDMIEFNLDLNKFKEKKQRNVQDCKKMEKYLKQLVIAQDKVFFWLKANLWDTMGVHAQSLDSIFGNFNVFCYTLLPDDPNQIEERKCIVARKKIEKLVSYNDTFFPFNAMTKDDLELKLKIPPNILTVEPILKVVDEKKEDLDTDIAIYGSIAPLFIDISIGHTKQRQISTFYQVSYQHALGVLEVIELKKVFNKELEQMRKQKEREMSIILEKNARLRQIISEINYFSNQKVNINIPDPEWNSRENPAYFITINDNELSILPYVSPSEQLIIDANAAEAERQRLLLLADDFRERALMAMMNGVLEIRWEDELRKEVPVPKCMIEKQPEQYNEEDLRLIRDYEEKSANLNSEREKYKKMLSHEYSKIGNYLQESIRKFNLRLFDLIELKSKIDSANNHENLKINRMRLNEHKRMQYLDKEIQLKKTIEYNKEIIENLQNSITLLQETIQECRVSHDAIQVREKLLEKSFKRDFSETLPLVQEQAYKLYKKRPKISLRNVNSTTALYELYKCVLTQNKPIILTPDCLEYLKALDTLDLYAGVPPTIDESTFQIIVKHRRLRIEHEIRIKAMQVELSEGDATVTTFQRTLGIKKQNNVMLHAELTQVRTNRLNFLHNIEMQFILRKGLVEVPLTGEIKDFEDAILINRKEVDQINQVILTSGSLKLDALKQNMTFHRRIMLIEYTHKKLRMHINDFVDQLKEVESTKVTKEIQQYLKGKATGIGIEAGTFEMELEILSSVYENLIKEKKELHEKLLKQIKYLKDNNRTLNRSIRNVNIDVCLFNLQKDSDFEIKEKELLKLRLHNLLKRSTFVNKVQNKQNEILMLQTELELLRLKTYPTFEYNLL